MQAIPVLILHGTPSHPLQMRSLARSLRRRGHEVAVPALPRLGTGELSRADDVVARAVGELGDRVAIVGHSAGGLVALRAAQNAALRPRIRVVVGLGAAFLGAPGPSAFTTFIHRVAPAVGEYSADEPHPAPEVPDGVRVFSVVSDADRVVPPEYSQFGEVVEVSGVSHARLPAQHDLIASLLERG